MLAMSTRKNKSARKRTGKALNVWIDASLRDQIDALVEQYQPRSTLKHVVEYLLRAGIKSASRKDKTDSSELP